LLLHRKPFIAVLRIHEILVRIRIRKSLFCLLGTFRRYIYIIFQRSKVIKKSQNNRNQCFSFYFSLMIDGSRRPKNSFSLNLCGLNLG
jgi:hypothetical protein